MELEENPEFNENPWENDDYGSLKMSMADLKHFITKSMVEMHASTYSLLRSETLLPLYHLLRDLLAEPGFMKEGGILGVHCSHAYPHASSQAQELLPKGLKGVDLAVYSVFKSLGIDTHILPVLRQKRDELMEDSAVEDMLKFLRDGEEFEPYFAQVPQILPLEPDLEKYWKMLYVSRRLYGTGKIIQFAKEKELEMDPGFSKIRREITLGPSCINTWLIQICMRRMKRSQEQSIGSGPHSSSQASPGYLNLQTRKWHFLTSHKAMSPP
ncbi:hypothetical protein PEBR_19672 [Penicillium brasilianum]|uniref:Uncharacterized protein n=1 Tax=Penicillium brasilianum TaxID=104259 RepID=A0A1S9RN67_PENBI|nr:hypothetical protein PEBR_19672 [Penicillium brasilianum]